ncbi:glycosyltransferase [Promicromonospora sp. NPDC023805]|uniref:glycosyltransferase family 2 protein n=1 Tax=Promicromonospora sp. NPDC023805 TaxID=3154696 RepID=UPI0033E603B0
MILVDNGSADGSVDAVAAAHPDVTVIRLPRNVGAAVRTVGVRAARTQFVAFADDDSWWAPGALRAAVARRRRRDPARRGAGPGPPVRCGPSPARSANGAPPAPSDPW